MLHWILVYCQNWVSDAQVDPLKAHLLPFCSDWAWSAVPLCTSRLVISAVILIPLHDSLPLGPRVPKCLCNKFKCSGKHSLLEPSRLCTKQRRDLKKENIGSLKGQQNDEPYPQRIQHQVTIVDLEHLDVGFPSVCCECVLVPLVNKESALSLWQGRLKLSRRSKERHIEKVGRVKEMPSHCQGDRSRNFTW